MRSLLVAVALAAACGSDPPNTNPQDGPPAGWADGHATIPELVDAARSYGWTYLGITDHSQSAFYAGGLRPDDVARQHDEIDTLNATLTGFRILKGIEADVLANGHLDYDDDTLDRADALFSGPAPAMVDMF